MEAKNKIRKRLSGEGHIGAFCPKCYQPLEFTDQEVRSDIYEYWVCRGCLTQYSVRYSAVDWREEKGAEDLELEGVIGCDNTDCEGDSDVYYVVEMNEEFEGGMVVWCEGCVLRDGGMLKSYRRLSASSH